MDLKLKGKTALVTGGSEGIGKGIAIALAKEGVDVAICARRKEPLEAAAAEIAKATGRKIVPIAADLRQDKDAKNFIEQGAKALGRIDIMVNNAGSAAGGVIEHLTEDDWEKGLQLKFMGYVRCLRYVLPVMRAQGQGRVVNLIGNDGVKPSYWEICPGAANAAGQSLTLSLAGQYGRDGISFVEVNPSPTARRPIVSASCGFLIPPPTTELMFTWKSACSARNCSFLSSTFRLFLEISSGCTLSIEICR